MLRPADRDLLLTAPERAARLARALTGRRGANDRALHAACREEPGEVLLLTMALAKRVDHAWKLVRRAAGHRQERGALERIFAISVAVAFVIFTIWFLVIQGPGPSLAPYS